VWRKGIGLGCEVYRLAKKLHLSERFELGSQFRTASASITANIAEGKGRRTRAEYARFLGIARGSTREVASHLELSTALGFLKEEDVYDALCLANEVSRMLTAMINKLAP